MNIAERQIVSPPVATEEKGEFAGWDRFTNEKFNNLVGPFYHRSEDGSVRCAFRATVNNTNGNGSVHGGALLTFADFSMYVAACQYYATKDVITISISSEFLAAAAPGDIIVAQTEVVSAGRSIAVLRGILTASGRPILNYSGTFKRLPAAQATNEN